MKACVLVVACVTAGCFEKPPFAGGDDDGICPSGDDVSTHVDGARRVVCGPGYAMTFSERGHGFPSSFVVGGQELLGHGDTCEDEDGIGVGAYPADVIDGRDPPNPNHVAGGDRVATVELDTPFVIKLGLDWSASFAPCPFEPSGRTTFTFFRDGRIFRYDHIVDDSMATVAACRNQCAEASGPAWALTTYTTLVATPGQTIMHATSPPPNDHGGGLPFQSSEICVGDTGYAIAMGWPEPFPRRLRVPAPGTIAVVEDLLDLTAATLPEINHLLHTAFVVGAPGETCTTVEPRVRPYSRQDPQLVVNGVPGGILHDGIYGGETTEGEVGQGVPSQHVELTSGAGGDVPAGFVVWLTLPASHPTYRVVKTGGSMDGTWMMQASLPGTDDALFWFRDPLRAGEMITIDPPP